MPKEEIPVQINANDADLFTTPPRRIQWPHVCVTDKQCNRQRPPIVSKRPAQEKLSLCSVNCLDLLHHG
ncbi:MAG: hypothetical protein K8R87_14360 [Verrucomicrobia bacterium]|nr:hypothetical protein [Verrucomicrobiota bacterium]